MIRKSFILLIALASILLNTGCVHEFPELPARRSVTLKVSHELPWTLFYFNLTTRNGEPATSINDIEGCSVGYTFELYSRGRTDYCVERYYINSSDISLADFTTSLSVPPGEWDLWIWSDYTDPATGHSLFYDSSIFNAITLTEPYRGDTYRKDAFQGMVTLSVPDTDAEFVEVYREVSLRRPLTGYAFIANDVNEFVEQETHRLSPGSGGGEPAEDRDPSGAAAVSVVDFSQYTCKVTYTGYLPNVYSIFRNKPVDSMLGVSYSGRLEMLESGNVLLAFDTAFINGEESTLTMNLEVFDPQGSLVSAMGGIIIPTKRNRATIVEAPFLTTKAQSGVNIDTSFSGDFNIQL